MLAVGALGAIGAALLSGGGDEDNDSSAVTAIKGGSDGGATSPEAASISATIAEDIPNTETAGSVTIVAKEALKKEEPKLEPIRNDRATEEEKVETKITAPLASDDSKAPMSKQGPDMDDRPVDDSSKETEEEFTAKLQAAEKEMKDALVEAAEVKKKKQPQQQSPTKKSSLFDNDPPVIVTKANTKTTNFVYEDDEDDSDWLRVLMEIREEEKNDEDDDVGMVDYASLTDDTEF